MTDIAVNGNSYQLVTKGDLELKNVKSPEEIKYDYKDDIVLQQSNGKLTSIRADELDIQGTWYKPFSGLPKKGDEIKLFDDNGSEKLSGNVVFSDNENDVVTRSKHELDKAKVQLDTKTEQVIENTNQTIKETIKEVNKVTNKAIDNVNDSINQNPEAKEVKKAVKEVKQNVESTFETVNNTAKDIVEGNRLTLGQMDTFKEKNFDFGAELSKTPSLTGRYTFDVKKLDENVNIEDLKNPHSEVWFLAQSAGVKVGPKEVSAGYKVNLGVEFNKPFKDDFSVSVAGFTNAGYRPEYESAFLDLGVGVEGRYQISNKASIYAMPFVKGDIISKKPEFKTPGIELGVNIKL